MQYMRGLGADAAKYEKKGEIIRVVMTSGVTIEFSKGQPGRIDNGSITGKAERVTGELDKAYIIEKEADRNGKIQRVLVSIPLSEVEQIEMKVKELKIVSTILVVIGIALIVAMYAAGQAMNSWTGSWF